MISHLLVRKPQYGNALIFQKSLPLGIIASSCRIVVDRTVDLDGQPFAHAIEIDHVGTDAVLPPELAPGALAPS